MKRMIVGRNWGLGLLFVLLLSVLVVELRAAPDEEPSVRRVESVTPRGGEEPMPQREHFPVPHPSAPSIAPGR